jgi:hypothetical protein
MPTSQDIYPCVTPHANIHSQGETQWSLFVPALFGDAGHFLLIGHWSQTSHARGMLGRKKTVHVPLEYTYHDSSGKKGTRVLPAHGLHRLRYPVEIVTGMGPLALVNQPRAISRLERTVLGQQHATRRSGPSWAGTVHEQVVNRRRLLLLARGKEDETSTVDNTSEAAPV